MCLEQDKLCYLDFLCAAESPSQEATEEASEEPSVKPKFQAKLVCGILSHMALHGWAYIGYWYCSWISTHVE